MNINKRKNDRDFPQKVKKTKIEEPPPQNFPLGAILVVTLRNFMCHENLIFEFGPSLNFLTGQNGSGKSAVLTGILLALGGSSISTGRFSNIKGFIKKGKQKARIVVTLCNVGESAYKPNIYGTKIFIERNLSIQGASSYKIKSSEEKLVSTSKDELNTILEYFDIQIGNPVSVLTQEASRTFLMSKNAMSKKLYDLYYRGCGLKILQDKYDQIDTSMEESEGTCNKKEEALQELEKEVKTLKRYSDCTGKIRMYKNELSWAYAIETEQELQNIQNNFNDSKNNLSATQIELQKTKDALDKEVDNFQNYRNNKERCKNIISENKKSFEEVAQKQENISLEIRTIERSLNTLKRQEQEIVTEMLNLERGINEVRDRNEGDITMAKENSEQKIAHLQSEIDKLSLTLKENSLRSQKMSEEKSEMENKLNNAIAFENRILNEINGVEKEIYKLKQAFNNRMCIFGEKTPQVLDELNRRKHEFKRIPVGPIGWYIEVKDLKWCLPIENSISVQLLFSFCCDNVEDSEKLKSILQTYYHNRIPSIIVNRFLPSVHQFNRIDNCKYPTVLDMLNISNNIVANCLIDQANIENKILIENSMEATNFMIDYDKNIAKKPTSNMISTAYTLDCTQLLVRPYRCYPYTRPKRNSILGNVRQDDIREDEQNKSQLESQYNEIHSERLEIQTKLKTFPTQFQEIEKSLTFCTAKINRNKSQIYDLQQLEEVKDVHYLQNEHQQLEMEKEKKKEEMLSCKNKLSILKKSNDDINKKKTEIMSLLVAARKDFDDLSVDINNTGAAKENLTTVMKRQEANIRDLEKLHENFKNDISNTKKSLKELLQTANNRCERIHPEHSSAVIKKNLEKTEKFIQDQKKNNSDDYSEMYLKKEHKLREAKGELEKLKTCILLLQNMKEKRRKHFKDINHSTKYVLNINFTAVLKAINISGKLQFNDETGTLDLDISNKEKRRVKYSTLSGGERNYITIAFLLSLWTRISMPFRILDECDVFMDSKNRWLTIKQLIRETKRMKNVQFICVTPQGLPKTKSANVKVHEMKAPRRGKLE